MKLHRIIRSGTKSHRQLVGLCHGLPCASFAFDNSYLTALGSGKKEKAHKKEKAFKTGIATL